MSEIKDVERERKKKRIIKTEVSQTIDIKKSMAADSLQETNRTKFHAEEEEAMKRDPEKDLDMFMNACLNIRNSIVKIKDMKSRKANADIEGIRSNACLEFITLKKMNRLSQFRCRKMREATIEAKQRIDKHHLQLQNLQYEAMHLQKEITKCLEFKSKDEEIELIEVEDFYKEAPSDISKPDVTRSDPHQLTLARLDWELEQRKQLATNLKQTQANKEQITQEIKDKEQYLDSLQPKLSSILQATKPVQSYLGMPYDEVREQHEIAYHLPPPLYVLYMQSSAYQEACDKKMKVTIDGDVEAAKASQNSVTPDVEEESDSDQEEQEKKPSKRRRKTVEARESDKKDRVLRKHPLSIVLDITCKDGSSVCLTFNYLINLKIITVSVQVINSADSVMSSISGGDLLSADSILDELYDDDHGNISPNQANHFDLKRLGTEEFPQYLRQVGRPYLWAQWLCGLQFLSEDGPSRPKGSLAATHMQQTVRRVRQRLRSRHALLRQLVSLEGCSTLIAGESLTQFPSKVVAHITSWRRSTYEDFRMLTFTKEVIEKELVNELDMFFVITMDRGSAKLMSQVVISANYPKQAPMFVVNIVWQSERSAQNDVHVKELEEEVNIHYEELIQSSDRNQLLANQVHRLLVCFDVYLETEPHNQYAPQEIPREKVFPRLARGPSRQKPYKYVPQFGVFTQR